MKINQILRCWVGEPGCAGVCDTHDSGLDSADLKINIGYFGKGGTGDHGRQATLEEILAMLSKTEDELLRIENGILEDYIRALRSGLFKDMNFFEFKEWSKKYCWGTNGSK